MSKVSVFKAKILLDFSFEGNEEEAQDKLYWSLRSIDKATNSLIVEKIIESYREDWGSSRKPSKHPWKAKERG